MKIRYILLMAAMMAAGACTSDREEGRAGDPVAIKLTATVKAEILRSGNQTTWTRNGWSGSMFSPLSSTRAIQEDILASNQKVYLWADKGTAGTYDYLKAWELTSEGDGNLSSTTTQYYPADVLTFRAVHGNFTSDPIEGTTAIGELTHTVDADQSATGAYERSDLMYATGLGSWESGGTIDFIHQLSKIEINLLAGTGLIPSDLENVVVQIKNVKPSITINAADGTLGLASGDAITVTARRTGTLFEAVIPPQELADGSITILRNGVMQTIPTTVASFVTNSRYVYNVNCSNRDKHLNPLWYVAENNVKSYNAATNQVTLETYPASAGSSQCYNWTDAMAYFAKQSSSYDEYWAGDIYDGSSEFKYHMPCQKEWYSVLPTLSQVFDTSSFMVGGGKVSSAQTSIFGYSSETKSGVDDWSYWSSYTASSNVRYAIRFLGTPYCSVWKYEVGDGLLTITSKLIDYLASDTDDAILSSLLSTYIAKSESWWNFNDENEGDIQRKLYPVGTRYNGGNGGTGIADYNTNQYGGYWSVTEIDANNTRRINFGNNHLILDEGSKIGGYSVRLFRNEGPAAARTESGIALASVTSADVGKVICTNSMVYPTVAVANSVGATPSAIIAYVGSAGDVDASSNTYRGLAIALKNAVDGNGYWSQNNTSSISGQCIYQTNNVNTAIGYKNGIACTTSLVNSNSSSLYAFCRNHDHHAAKVVRNFSAARPEGVSLWFLPSMGQWNLILKSLTGTNTNVSTTANATFEASNVNKKIIAAGGTGFDATRYWASTEQDASRVWRISFMEGDGLADSHSKTGSERVRSVFAFE